MSDNRPPAYYEDQTLVIRASSLGGPICQMVASALGNDILPPPKWLQKAFDEGNFWEGPMLEELKRRGWRNYPAIDAQMEHDYHIVPGVIVRFHPDEVMIPVGNEVPTSREARDFPEGPVLVEAKALSAANYEAATKGSAADLPYAYDWQLSVMMLALELPAVWVTVDKSQDRSENWAAPIGELNDDGTFNLLAPVLATLHAEYVKTPPISKSQIIKRVLEIKRWIEKGALPDDEASHNANPCRFLYLCPKAAEQKETVVVLGERGDEVARWAMFYEQQKRNEELTKERKEEARAQLIELIGGDARVAAGGFVVTKTEVAGRKSFDRKAAEKAGLNLEPYTKVGDPSTRLMVERAGGGDR